MKVLIAMFAALAVSGGALAQETAGRVLLSVGSVALVRGGATSVPAVGTAVQAGDTFRLGEQSHVQLRMTDQSLVSLQPNTTFTISEYAFTGREPGSQRTVFTLAQGAMRTVTGLIGRIRQDDYKVNTPTSTIGVRGTHYQIAHLLQPRGDLAAGTYGAVTDGKISVSTQGGERSFGADQHFHVARGNDAAVGRAGPPPRLSQIAPPARPQPQQQEQQQAKGETTAAVASSGDSRVSNASNGVAVSPAVRQDSATATSVSTGGGTTTSGTSTESAPVAAQPAALISVSGPATVIGGVPIVQPGLTGTVFYRLAGPFNIPVSCATGTGCSPLVNGSITLGVNLTQQLVGISINVISSDGSMVNIGTPSQSGGIPVTISNGVITFNQTFRLVDFPQNQGAFRCFDCGSGPTAAPNFVQTMTFSGTINGPQATLTVALTDTGGGGQATAVLTQATPPNNFVSAATLPNLGSGNSVITGAFWAVNVDSSGRLIESSSGATTGVAGANPAAPGPRVFVNTAGNFIKGSSADGNLVWGAWGSGASVTDFNYNTFTPSAFQTPVHWITGTATNNLPPSLGVLTYTPVGYFINNGSGILNSATLKADFVARSIALNMTASQNAGAAFTMAGVTSFSPVSGRFGAGFQSVSCAGASCPAASSGGSFGGFFAGPNAEGAGIAFTAGVAGVGGVTGVVGLKR